ncbi:uncharacterized protein LOC132546716 [Ylistrum balloti]|uniref:uncharacterized protein LOC132546716 n=1 Tax=Ylistrum balloti TaxID=509963 RepID=UPI002905C6CB|nr:uncharacterized protein LOC132546716 [Ylistrum balloti]
MASATGHHDQLRQCILDKLDGNPFYKETDVFLKLLFERSLLKQDQRDHEQAEKWLFWARHESKLRCVKAGVPIGILPEGIEGELVDVKVFSRGPDDAIYDNNDLIRRKVARGNCFLHLTSGPETGVSCVLQAMKKFTGGLGDDDDRESGDTFVWQKYFTKSLDDASVVIATRKANGEAAHLSCCMIGGEYVLCGGSKNVHMLFRRKEDIRRYGEPRFRIAREVCSTIMDSIDKMNPQEKERLLKFLVTSKFTGVFEILAPDHQHVEDLSHLSGPELHFITWTRCDLDPSGEDVAAVPPHIGIEIAQALGLKTVKYNRVDIPDLDKRMKEIRGGYQFEGEVLYFLDNQGVVMGLLKKKTVWYIMCRAIREKLRAACTSLSKYREKFTISKVLRKTQNRMLEIQKWLTLDDEVVIFWNNLGAKFLRWTLQKFEEGTTSMEEVADKFPVLWKSFLQSTQECDDYAALKRKEADDVDPSENHMTSGSSNCGSSNSGSSNCGSSNSGSSKSDKHPAEVGMDEFPNSNEHTQTISNSKETNSEKDSVRGGADNSAGEGADKSLGGEADHSEEQDGTCQITNRFSVLQEEAQSDIEDKMAAMALNNHENSGH